jgi:hypothetical protein
MIQVLFKSIVRCDRVTFRCCNREKSCDMPISIFARRSHRFPRSQISIPLDKSYASLYSTSIGSIASWLKFTTTEGNALIAL